jgi:hypothetical protein
MSSTRSLERSDLPQVAALFELVARSGQPHPPAGLAGYFERVLVDQPWADSEIPSLVHVDDDGRIVAFQGSSTRRARFDGRPIRIGCAGQLVAHPDARHLAVGARLLRIYMKGPQELTVTDTANDQTRGIWMPLGGEAAHLSCIGWLRVLRPWRFAESYLRDRHKSQRRTSGVGLLRALDAATTKMVGRVSPPPAPAGHAEPLTPGSLVEHLPTLARGLRLHLDYDERYLGWLFDELAALTGLGTPVAQLVRSEAGHVIGWYVYFLALGGISRVLQVAAATRHAGEVLDHLLHHAWSNGAAAVLGRMEPQLVLPLADRQALLHRAGSAALVHSRDPEILGAIASGRALLTRLDAEWWIQDKMVDLEAVSGAARANDQTCSTDGSSRASGSRP